MDSDGKRKKVQNSHFCIVKSAKTGPLDTLSFPSLPTKETSQVRYIQCITRPNHIVWTLKTGPEVKNLFTENFPRIDFDSMVSNDEWDRFAKARSKAFPPCQYCPALQASAENGESGVVLLGDAAHSFSPDIGQGVNSGLLDVVQLQKALVAARGDNSGSSAADGSLGTALKEYERVQAPEVSL
jgi:kynurenine 3-monooxygenase